MKNLNQFLLLLLLICSSGVLAQDFLRLPIQERNTPAYVIEPIANGPLGDSKTPTAAPRSLNFLNQEALIGTTLYDLQSNAAMSNRLVIGAGGYKAAVWMLAQSFEADKPDRGTGFNEFVDGSWGEMPSSRLETTRTGWPSIVQLGDGSLHVTTHTGGQNLLSLKRLQGSSNWVEQSIPNSTPDGLLWPRTAAGGPDGNTIHLISLTTPADGLGGSIYEGMNGHPLYARSSDGGGSWDKVDQIIPGLDRDSYYEIEGDSYAIAARGNVVATVVFANWGDIALFKSFDNGDTWEKTVINDFPLDRYQVDDGYTTADIPFDPNAPDSMAIYTCDGSGGVAIDKDGLVHVSYSDAYVNDNDFTDGQSSFYPGWSGISYWNETMLESVTIANFLDYDNNDTIDLIINEIPRYGNGTTTSQSVITTDDNGGVYIVYSMVSEAFFNEQDQQNYRHLVSLKSLDGGQTWGSLYDLINPELSDPEVYEFIEAVFPSIGGVVNDTLHLLYQQDFFPGYTAIDSLDPQADNFAAYSGVPVSFIPAAGATSAKDFQELHFEVSPNPTSGSLNIVLSDNKAGAKANVRNAQGQLLFSKDLLHRDEIDLTHLSPGFYLLEVLEQSGRGVRKIIKL